MSKSASFSSKPEARACAVGEEAALYSSVSTSDRSIRIDLSEVLTDEYSAASSPTAQARASGFDEKLADFDTNPILTCA